MLPNDLVIPIASFAAAATVLLRAIVARVYVDHDRVLRHIRLRPGSGDVTYYVWFDAVLAPLPFCWCWLDIFVAVLVCRYVDHVATYVVLTTLVGGRFRALQEVGHNAVHSALCRSTWWQWLLSNLFFQYPVFKRDMQSRYATHVREHHRNPNKCGRDPNLARIIEGGMVEGISRARFYFVLLYPVTPAGLRANVSMMLRNSFGMNRSRWAMCVRIAAVSVLAGTLFFVGGTLGLLFGYLLPLLTTYPLFSWLSLLAEHRWHNEEDRADRLAREFSAGRPTDFCGISGWLLRLLIFPMSDAYHLAHSLYPYVRWNHLPAIDALLKIEEPRYTAHISRGYLLRKEEGPSALSELRDRVTARREKLTEWAA